MMDKNLLAYIKGKTHLLILITLFSFLSLVASVGLTALLCLSIESFYNGNDGWWYLLFALGCAILVAFFHIGKSKLTSSLADYVSKKVRDDTYEKYVRLEGHCPYTAQEIAQLSSEGVEQLRLYYTSYLPSFFFAMLAPISLFVMFMFFSWKVAILYLACVPLIPMSIIMVSKWAKKIFATYWDKYISLGGAYLDSVSGMKELLIFHYDKQMEEKMKRDSEEFRKITMKVLVMQLASTTIMDVVAYGGAAVGITLTLLGANNGEFSLFVALFLCLVGAEFFLPMRALGSAFHVAMNGATSGKKVLGLLKEADLPSGNETLSSFTNIDIQNLSFAYKDSKSKTLQNLNIHLEKGLNALIGETGSGKSTLAKILSKQLFGYEGSIKINDKELSSISLSDFHSRCFYLSSDSFLLHKSVKEAFLFYCPNLEEERMWELLEKVSMAERIKEAGGLDYLPKEGASDLSGGEKQRLLLAYYLSSPRDFCIFDETTSNIDKESEAIIIKMTEALAESRIVLLISHRLQNALNARMVYRIDSNGTIKESGTPSDLLSKESEFKKALSFERLGEALA
ncbi:MAG: ATP-binding cassette domain-containing protein [Bacilli bacterium]|nr:ATP-binding cassette domain-containing protein [Bacilli bacterium]